MKIEVNTQSSIKIIDGITIYIDPFQIEQEPHDADFILITHEHYDHFDIESIHKVKKENTILIVPDSIITKVFPSGFNMKNVRGVLPNESYTIDGLSFETIPSYNINKQFHPKEKKYVGYILNLSERILISGDTDATEELKQVNCDIACIPIGGTYTMTVDEAAEVIHTIKPKKVIPTHYGSIVGDKNLGEKLKEKINKDTECILVLD